MHFDDFSDEFDYLQDYVPANDFAQRCNVSKSTVYNWIKKEKISFIVEEGKYVIVFDKKTDQFITDRIIKNAQKKSQPYIPKQLIEYNQWHTLIDYISWLFKICYSNREHIRNKKFRIDEIFQNYISINKIGIKPVKALFSNKFSQQKEIYDDLKRGWYNELSFLFPLKKSTIGISTNDLNLNEEITDLRFQFPSWKIISMYYSVYFYIRSINILKNTTFRKEEHKININVFKNCVMSSLNKKIWCFPLNITYDPGERIYRKQLLISRLPHLNYKYCIHPREPRLSPIETFDFIYSYYKDRGKAFNNTTYCLIDFLSEFRIWANYIDITNLVSLYGKAYKGYLDQNLSLILFMVAGLSEICLIAAMNDNMYIDKLQSFYDTFIQKNDIQKINFTNTSLYQRYSIYKKLGYVKGSLNIIEEPNLNEINFY